MVFIRLSRPNVIVVMMNPPGQRIKSKLDKFLEDRGDGIVNFELIAESRQLIDRRVKRFLTDTERTMFNSQEFQFRRTSWENI